MTTTNGSGFKKNIYSKTKRRRLKKKKLFQEPFGLGLSIIFFFSKNQGRIFLKKIFLARSKIGGFFNLYKF